MGRGLYVESVEDAAALAGGHDRLAAVLGVTPDDVRGWCAGERIPQLSIFLRLIDLVTGASHPASSPTGRSTTAAPAAEPSATTEATRQAVEA
jgi:hypothetical protein